MPPTPPRARLRPDLLIRRTLRLGALAALLVGAGCTSDASDDSGTLACDGNDNAFVAQMDAYSDAEGYRTDVVAEDGLVSAVSVGVPAIEFTGEGTSSTLPVGPCQHIYRYKYLGIDNSAVQTPFEYVEIDWNTEGEPRGPNGSFSSAHFDFHFYLRPQAWVDAEMQCMSSNGKTCDPALTEYAQMRRFQLMPEPAKVPPLYRADIDSAIPTMGLHLLDYTIQYTVETVDHYPTLIYGTFDGEVVFMEASVTLQTLQDAVAAPNHRVSFRVRQPVEAPAPRWPQSFDVVHDPETGGFTAAFSGFAAATPPGRSGPPR